MDLTPPPVRIGQVYRDCACALRNIRVENIINDRAVCRRVWKTAHHKNWMLLRGGPARIRLDRLTSSRFELVEDVTG